MQKGKTREARYLVVFSYTNHFRRIYQTIMLILTHYPSLIVTVFLRKGFGERYFTLASSITFGVILAIPYFAAQELRRYTELMNAMNFTWLLFVLAFIGFSIKRRMEFSRKSKTIRTDRFSYYEGEVNYPLWVWVESKTKFLKADKTYIKRFYEPLLTLLAGIGLMVLYLPRLVGVLLVVVSLLQYIRVSIQYAKGRDFLMDEIDSIIARQNLRDTIVFDKPSSETQGYSIFAPRPESMDIREKIVDQIFADEKKEKTVTL